MQAALPYVILYKSLVGLAVAGMGYLIMMPFRFVVKEWRLLKGSLADMQAELVQQRSNHLEHIQADGEKQVQLLGKVVDTLDGLRLDTQQQTGFIQGLVARPRSARAKK